MFEKRQFLKKETFCMLNRSVNNKSKTLFISVLSCDRMSFNRENHKVIILSDECCINTRCDKSNATKQ